jgi:hypothetical protein
MAVSVAQPYLRGANTPQYYKMMLNILRKGDYFLDSKGF